MWVVTTLGSVFAFAALWATGANDVANAVGTAVGCHALSVRQAVILAGVFEFLGSSLISAARPCRAHRERRMRRASGAARIATLIHCAILGALASART